MENLVERARELAPGLAERAQRAEELRRLPDETIAELTEAGFLEVLVPESLGGRELDLATLSGIARELGAGCASTGWVSAIYMLHNWLLALFPEEAQHEAFADRPYVLVPCTLAPPGKAEPAPGGFRVSGRWSWGTGIMHADWVMVLGLEPEGPRVFLLPAAEVAVHDVWYTSGMRGTGSNDIEVVDRFVPRHRTLSLVDLAGGNTPGGALHPGELYRWPMVPVLTLAGAAPLLGAAEGLLARFTQRLQERVLVYSGVRQRDRTPAQMRLARATIELRSARLLLDDAIAGLQNTPREEYGLRERARARLVGAQVVAAARTVVSDLCLAAGASAQLMHQPFQRVQRDLNTISGHVIYDLDETYALYGQVALGLELSAGALV